MTTPSPPANAMQGVPEHILTLLDRLHAQSDDQESKITRDDYSEAKLHDTMRDKFIALPKDKAHYVYTLCRAIGARTIVEAGTSFGVSTIYLALAAAANAAASGKGKGAARAREHWAECGEAVSDVIELREGDLRETLKENVEDVDFLLLDIWTPMALPTLKLVHPKLTPGAVVITDNTIMAAEGYAGLFEYLKNQENGFITVTLPYEGV
ncbi:hypothetical protein PT974_02158 [Cladobotryum mycophilum]|uniref:O-methyltransferase n=1 Tax=Cladobotryum mycophilum TaxID=491253 RepID=A0ABR0SXS0_9HYPO